MNKSSTHAFSVHPSVIKSIILEQAGDPCKAIAELVMNSVDAKASYVDITLDSKKFTVVDDGVGFKNKEEVTSFFGTFSMPHTDGDSTYGVFRCGRGQIFAISESEWRSGNFLLSVNLDGLEGRKDVGYGLLHTDDEYPGCSIKGEFFTPLHKDGIFLNADHFNSNLSESLNAFTRCKKIDLVGLLGGQSVFGISNRVLIRLFELCLLVPIPVRLNGVLISGVVELIKTYSDEFADYYNFTKKIFTVGAVFLNQGVHINTNRTYPVSCVINFKKKPNINLARNSINKKCPIFIHAFRQHGSIALQGFINGESYYEGLKKNFIYALSRASSGKSGVYNSYSYFPRKYDKDLLDKILKLIPVNTLSLNAGKLNLYELIVEICEDREAFYTKYRRSPKYGFSDGVLKHKKQMLAHDDKHTVIYGIGGDQDNLSAFFINIEYLYGAIGVDLDLVDVYEGLGVVESEGKGPENHFMFDGGVLSCGHYLEVAPQVLKRNVATHELIVSVIHALRDFLKKNLGGIDLPEAHILVDDLPFEIRFMTRGSTYSKMDSSFEYMANVHFNGTHFIALDLKKLKQHLQNLAIDPGAFYNSLASKFYEVLLSAGHVKGKPLNILHALREKNEEFLFLDNGFRCEISRLDGLMADFWRDTEIKKNNPKTNFMTAKMMANTQKKYAPYKAFFDKEFGGLSADIDQTLTKILSVET